MAFPTLQGYMDDCRALGIRRVVVGKGTRVTEEAQAAAGAVQADGKPLVEVMEHGLMLDSLQHFFPPAPGASSAAAAGAGPET